MLSVLNEIVKKSKFGGMKKERDGLLLENTLSFLF